MRELKKCTAVVLAAALCLTGIPQNGMNMVRAEEPGAVTVDYSVKLKPYIASTFHDTNGDGLGEFEGWGTSLCWWANRIGYSDALTSEAARLFFSDEGLDMNIGRYNIGGGDHVGVAEPQQTTETKQVEETAPASETEQETAPAAETQATIREVQIYDLETEGRKPTYAGTEMKINEIDMSSFTYQRSDEDFGIKEGDVVGKFKNVGYINKFGDGVNSGDSLHFTVNVSETGNYTVKLLLTLSGSNNRDVAVRVEGAEKDLVVDKDTINQNKIAEGSNQSLYLVTIENVALQAGENKVEVAGKNDWTLDFVKMAVIRPETADSGDQGGSVDGETENPDQGTTTEPPTPIPETERNEFIHAPHIIRSDSAVPGYAKDVTKIIKGVDIKWYTDRFARVDEECGYAWNYDWDADKNQMNVLKAAAKASRTDFIAEAFSNSPPYFMTVSGCSSGNTNAGVDNLRADSVNAFAKYMADVIEHWQKEGVISFQSATPMNEPYTNYWGAYSNKQEGCHFDQGESQSRIIVALNRELQAKGINLIISATDETSIDTQIDSYNKLSAEAKAIVKRIDTHTYSGSKRTELNALAESAGMNLWMSEVDGAFVAGSNAGEMGAALGLAQRIMTDVNGLESTAWILWNAIDSHSDSKTKATLWPKSENDFASMTDLYKAVDLNKGYWGLAFADHDNGKIETSMKYYGFGQFSRYIRPGYTIIGTNRGSVLAAYDPAGKKAVIVAMNTTESDKTWKFDLSGFETMGSQIKAIRTSGSLADGEKWADVTAKDNIVANTTDKYFTATMKANSITTYIVEGVSGIKAPTEEEITYPSVKQIPVSKEQVTGSEPWSNDTTPPKDYAVNIVDNNYETFFDGVLSGWAIIDLEEPKEIAAISYAPRNGYADRCLGASIYGSNDGEKWTLLYTIDTVPAEKKDTYVYTSDFFTSENKFQYIKYAQTESGNANLAELKLYELGVERPYILQIPVTGEQVEGSQPWNNDASHAVSKIVDNNYGTFFDGLTNGWAIIDLKEEKEIAAVGYAPRNGYRNRCEGAVIYGSNDKETWVPLYKVKTQPEEKKDTIVYADEFQTKENKFRYIKYANDEREANLSELKVYESAVYSKVDCYIGEQPVLPAKVGVTGTAVVWDAVGSTSDVKPFTSIIVKGRTESGQAAAAEVYFIPKRLEYMIDCANEKSETWKMLRSRLLNNKAADQAKTADNTWGYVGKVGSDKENVDMTVYDGVSDPYVGGYWAHGGKNISYAVTLPKGTHNIMIGTYEWWGNRKMEAYYSVDDKNVETKLCDFWSSSQTPSCASGEITLDKESVVTITIKKAPNQGDPIVSWIAVSRIPEEITEDRIAENDYLMYLVNCGTSDTSAIPGGYENMGLCQSVLDQRYAEDEETGLKWGLAADDANSVAVRGGDASLLGSYYYMSDKNVTYDKEKSGFLYTFELPERKKDVYIVTVGLRNPWGGTKYEDIVIEGKTVETAAGVTNSSTGFKGEYEVEVADRELNVLVKANPGKRNGTGDDPVINYIIVKAVPAYDLEALATAIEANKKKIDPNTTYGVPSLEAFKKTIADAEELYKKGTDHPESVTAEEIKAAIDAMNNAAANLKIVYTYDSITGTNGARMFDNNGNKIQAHGGQVQQFTVNGKTKWYWYGEDKTNGYRPVEGVHLYTSEDLYNWTDEGLALEAIDVPDDQYGNDKYVGLELFETNETLKNMYGDYKGVASDDPTYETKLEEVFWNLAEDRCVMERPKVLYNEKTHKYVMWWHCDGRTPSNTADYGKARAGVAIADTPAGPFKFVVTYLLASAPDVDHSWDDVGGHVRDMNLFKDDDGTAYVLYSSEGNAVMYIARLNDSYTGLAKPASEMVFGEDFTISSTDSREAPAMFKYDGKYYLITSGCTGWAPNQARYAVADSPLGPWTNMGDPCVGDTAKTTFATQSTCVIPVDPKNGKFIYMGDRWFNPDTGGDLSDSRYVWLPIEFGVSGTIMIKDYSNWKLDELEGKGTISIKTDLPDSAETVTDLFKLLPDKLDVTVGGKEYKSTPVTWSLNEDKKDLGGYLLGNVAVSAELTELGREFAHTAFLCPSNLTYFVDCYTNGDNTSAIFDAFAKKADNLLNIVSDQPYGDDFGVVWGYQSTTGASGGNSSQDMGSKGTGDFFSTGWWATGTGSIRYGFDLEPGEYVVATGYQEWWSGNRGMKVTAISVDAEGNETEIGTTSFTLKGQQDMQQNTTITVPEGSDHVVVKVSKESGGDPILSWIGVIDTHSKGTKKLDWTAFDAKMDELSKLKEKDYTSDSWKAFQEVVSDAKAFKKYVSSDTKQRDIRVKIAELDAAAEALISVLAPTGDVTYYVDAENGKDDNDGKTPETAWKTLAKASSIRQLKEGGKILLKAGCVWNGEKLTVKNAKGTEENPIVIGSYGEGPAPVINGNGADWKAADKEELAAVHIYNSEHIIVENLEITNWDASVTAARDKTYVQSTKLLSGLVVENEDAGELKNIVIRNNKIHDVNGLMKGGAEKAAGGLIVVVTGKGANHTGETESWYNGLTIAGNEVYDVCHEAIYMESVWASRKLVGGSSSDTSYQNAGNSKWIGSSNVLIENNYVHDVAGDGIVPINTTDALVQYNLIDNSADSRWDYKNNENHAALWTWDTDNVTFRYNEACNTSKASKGKAVGNDSMAFDFDYGVQNCLYEYNYSHDNLGGFLMLCPGPGATVNNIARYNVSVNDGLYDGAPMIRVGGGKYGSNGVQVYNNTMYWAGTGYKAALAPTSDWEGSIVKDVSIFNNIFCGPAKEDSVKKDGVTYYNNCVSGGAEEVYTAANVDENAVVADPKFVDMSQYEGYDFYTAGTWKDGETTLGKVYGLMLQEGSPCINKGAAHPAAPASKPASVAAELVPNTAKAPTTDYYGNALEDGLNDIGAYEYAAVNKEALDEQITEAEELTDGIVEEEYTQESYNRFKSAVARAQEVMANPFSTQAEVDAAQAMVKEAIKGLTKEEPAVNKEALQAKVDEAAAIAAEGYTAQSYELLQTAITSAKEVLANADASQDDVDAALVALTEAIDGLKEATPTPVVVDKSALQAKYNEALKIKADGYTKESFAKLQLAIKDAELVLANEKATEELVKFSLKNLEDAIAKLEKTQGATADATKKPSKPAKDSAVNTGDDLPLTGMVLVLFAAAAAASLAGVYRSKKKKR